MSTKLRAAEGVAILWWQNLFTGEGARHGWKFCRGKKECEVSKGKIRGCNIDVW